MSEEVTTFNWTAIIQLLLIVGILVAAGTAWVNSGNDVGLYEKNLDKAEEAVAELDQTIFTDKTMVFDPYEIGVFFREESYYVTQIIDDCWPQSLVYTTGQGGTLLNPAKNCLLSGARPEPLLIEKPDDCKGNCFCLLSLKKEVWDLEEYNIPGSNGFDINGVDYEKAIVIPYSYAECVTINKKPAAFYELDYSKEGYRTYGARNGEIAYADATLTEKSKTYGGAIINWQVSETQQVFFCRGQASNGGFYTVAYEELCSDSTPFS